MFIGTQKGRTTKERQKRRFGMPNPEGYRKALRLMKLAEKFNIPIITFMDTPGAYPGLEAEERGQGEAIAKNIYEMALLKVPVFCYVIGEGASGGALGISVRNKVYIRGRPGHRAAGHHAGPHHPGHGPAPPGRAPLVAKRPGGADCAADCAAVPALSARPP